jgi:hypothetical protein
MPVDVFVESRERGKRKRERERELGTHSNLGRPRRPASEATRVADRRGSRRAPRIVLVDVFRRKRCRSFVHRPVFRVRQRLLLPKPAEIDLPPTRHVVTLRATDEAALGVPERRLPVVAVPFIDTSDVGAVGIRWPVLRARREESVSDERATVVARKNVGTRTFGVLTPTR